MKNGRIYKSSIAFLASHQFSKSSKSLVYPNPSQDLFKVRTAKTILKMNVYDFSGKLIFSNIQSDEVNLSRFKAAVYFLEIIYKDQTRESTKIIKQ